MIEPASILAGLIVGGGLGVIAGHFLAKAGSAHWQRLYARAEFARLDLLAEKERRESRLRARRTSAKAEAQAIQKATHDELRAIVGEPV